MKRVATSAFALILAAGTAMADDHGNKEAMDETSMETEATMEAAGVDTEDSMMIRSRDIEGGAIYTTNEANDEGWEVDTSAYSEVGADWNEIGEIEDLVLNADGSLAGIVAEVGGFLDIADKHVLLKMEDMALVRLDNDTYVALTRYNEEQLEELEDIDEGWWD